MGTQSGGKPPPINDNDNEEHDNENVGFIGYSRSDNLEMETNSSEQNQGHRDLERNIIKTGHEDMVNNSNNVKTIKKRHEIYYKENSVGPFTVFVESNNNSNLNVGKFNYMKIAKEIFNMKLNNVLRIRSKGNNKIGVEFSSYAAANSFVRNKSLLDKGYNLYIPYNLVTCKGIVRRIDTDLNIDEIKYMLNSPFKVLDIVRLNRKVIKEKEVEYIPTGTLLVTFEGVILPRKIQISYISFPVSPYIAKVTNCFKCLMYGHTERQCKGKRRCGSCAETHTTDVEYNDCKKILCYHCKSEIHKSNYKECPEFIRQKNIKEKMSLDNISFYDAAMHYPKPIYKSSNESTDVILGGGDFPELNKKSLAIQTNENRINVNDRSQVHFSEMIKNKRNFAMACGNDNKIKKRIVQDNSGQLKSYNSYLNNPNGRISQMSPNGTAFRNNKGDVDNLKVNRDFLDSGNSKECLPLSANDNFKLNMESWYCNFLKFSEFEKNKIRDLILTYYRLQEVRDSDEQSEY